MTTSDLEAFKAILTEELSKPTESLSDRFSSVFKEIELGTFIFDRRLKLLNSLKEISREEVVDLFKSTLLNPRHSLSIQVFNNKTKVLPMEVEKGSMLITLPSLN